MSNNFGELVLLIGDFHIPHRVIDMPSKFKELLLPSKMQTVLCTGNIGCRDIKDWLKTLCSKVEIVKGDFDIDTNYPENKVITMGNWKFGLVHGHQIIPFDDKEQLLNLTRELDVDILI
jgi:vacuolar protein sorting-associated protein 29